MFRQFFIAGVLVALAAHLPAALAQPSKFLPFKRRTPQEQPLELSQDNGPWLIMCASFLGEDGSQQAKELVHELRSEYKLDAYLHAKSFDYSDKIVGLGWEVYTKPDGTPGLRPPQMRTAHAYSFDEYAVLVGNFASPEDRQAQNTLEKIKRIQPKTIQVSPTIETHQRMAVLRAIQQLVTNDPEMKELGPMRQAFMIPNPILPEDYFVQQGPDPFVVKMNRNIRYSLFKCPEPYTVRVATFRGKTLFKQSEMDADQRLLNFHQRNQQPIKSDLAEAANKAHILTTELRKAGFEAYEFHDRTESYVCVGSFPWATRQLPSGKDELNPEIAEVIQQFKARVDQIPGMQAAVRPKSLATLKGKKISFDIQPLPVKVPEKPERGLFGQFAN